MPDWHFKFVLKKTHVWIRSPVAGFAGFTLARHCLARLWMPDIPVTCTGKAGSEAPASGTALVAQIAAARLIGERRSTRQSGVRRGSVASAAASIRG